MQQASGEFDLTHDVLWTSGWDSTFRVLELVLVHGRRVQPHYLIDPDRPSTRIELETMARITAACMARAPRGAILPLRTTEVRALAPDPEITARWQRLRRHGRLGTQYDWLARYAIQHALEDLELSVHQLLPQLSEGFIAPATRRGLPSFALAGDYPADLAMFARFSFPVYATVKLEMRALAAAHGFADLLEMSWFCHTPLFGRFACGQCYPCRLTHDEGLGARIGLLGRVCMTPRFVLGDARNEALRERVRAGRRTVRRGLAAALPFLRRSRRDA